MILVRHSFSPPPASPKSIYVSQQCAHEKKPKRHIILTKRHKIPNSSPKAKILTNLLVDARLNLNRFPVGVHWQWIHHIFKFVSTKKIVTTTQKSMHRIAWPYMALAFALAFVFLFLMLAFVLFLMFALLFLHSLAELETCANDGVVEIKKPWISCRWTWIRPLCLAKEHVLLWRIKIIFCYPSARSRRIPINN